ncbi:694_t:CDS:2, partial [Dentiscutata erythropus]
NHVAHLKHDIKDNLAPALNNVPSAFIILQKNGKELALDMVIDKGFASTCTSKEPLIVTVKSPDNVTLEQILQNLTPCEPNKVKNGAAEIFVDREDGRTSNQSQDTYFGLCFGGYGIGKTELIKQFCIKMINEKDTLVFNLEPCYKFDPQICKEQQWLGLSLAAFYHGQDLSDFIDMMRKEKALTTFAESYEVLEFIIDHYRKWKNTKDQLCVIIWIDDYQEEMMRFTDPEYNIIKKIGHYTYSRYELSSAAKQNVILVPIISGTFGGDVRNTIVGSHYAAKILSIPPLSFKASLSILRISENLLESSSIKLKILISDIGGVARLLTYLRDLGNFSNRLKPLEEQEVDTLGAQMINRIVEYYNVESPIEQQSLTSLPKSTLKELVRRIITGKLIDHFSLLPGTEISYVDLNRFGIFHYRPVNDGRLIITMPYVFLWKLNCEVSLLPPEHINFPCQRWTWQDFERLEAHLETLRAQGGNTIQEQFPHIYANEDVLKWNINSWDKLIVKQESVQCMKKDMKHNFKDWSNEHLMLVKENDAFQTVFLCHTGNPAVDSHFLRIFESEYVLLLKQTKHSMPESKGKVSTSEAIRWYGKIR